MRFEVYSDRGGWNGTTRVKGYRERNEDTVLVEHLRATDGREFAVLVVCDGVGGGQKGKRASSMTCTTIRDFVHKRVSADSVTLEGLQGVIADAIREASLRIYQTWVGGKMSATTCTAVVTDGVSFRYVNVGDTRVYNVQNNGQAQQVSRDDSWVADVVESGEFTLEDARKHPNRHKITRAVGFRPDVQLRVSGEERLADALLLTSDGFSEFLTPSKFKIIMEREGSLPQMAQMMIGEGQKDNISALLFRKQ